MMKYLSKLLCLTFVALSLNIVVASAQQDDQSINIDDLITDTQVRKNDGYIVATVENLARLYWGIGKFDFDDRGAVEDFLRITECDIVTQFYHNDFEWDRIVEKTSQYLKASQGDLPRKFELVTTILLDRYDTSKQIFDVMAEYKMESLRQIDFARNSSLDRVTCGQLKPIDNYPENMTVILNRPLTLEEVPVKPELAKLYLEEARRQFERLPPKQQLRLHERMAFIRLKVTVQQYKETQIGSSGSRNAVVFGRLDGLEIYADPGLVKPLYFKDFESKKDRRSSMRERIREQREQRLKEVEQEQEQPQAE